MLVHWRIRMAADTQHLKIFLGIIVFLTVAMVDVKKFPIRARQLYLADFTTETSFRLNPLGDHPPIFAVIIQWSYVGVVSWYG